MTGVQTCALPICGKIAENAVVTMGGLFRADPRKLESGEIEDIIRESI